MSDTRMSAITIPKWGMSMEEGTVTLWHVRQGESVVAGQEVVDVESTKIASAIESKSAGVLRRQVANVGQTLPVGALLGVLAEETVLEEEIDIFVAQFKVIAVDDETSASGPSPQTVIVDGGQTIRYLVQGEGGVPILLIHGFGGDKNAWMFNQPVLAEKQAVYALDLPGHGGSSKDVVGGSIEELAKTVDSFLATIPSERVHLVGHSLGGAVALSVALARPDRISSLILVSSAALGAEVNGAYLSGFVAAQKRKDLASVAAKLFSDPSLASRRMIDDLLRMKRINGVDAALKVIAEANFDGNRQKIDLVDRANELDLPIQVIWGKDDAIISSDHARSIKRAELVLIDGAGHMPMMEKASEVNASIGEFIGKR